jgi:hypothetical protein
MISWLYLDFNYRFVLSAARQKHVVSKTGKVIFSENRVKSHPLCIFSIQKFGNSNLFNLLYGVLKSVKIERGFMPA